MRFDVVVELRYWVPGEEAQLLRDRLWAVETVRTQVVNTYQCPLVLHAPVELFRPDRTAYGRLLRESLLSSPFRATDNTAKGTFLCVLHYELDLRHNKVRYCMLHKQELRFMQT